MQDPQYSLKRQLSARHIAMIALGGAIGTGLFLASGNSIATAGPGGALLGYAIMGIMVYFLMTSLGEMATLMPTTGTFCDYSGKFVDPAFGFAMGYNYFYNWAITIAAELTAASILMQYWFPHVPVGVWALGFLVLMSALNYCNVQVYGESEYWFACVKITAVIIFIVVGTLMIFGLLDHQAVGFHNWTLNHGPFQHGWYGFLMVFLVVGFSFQGTELVGVAAGEVDNPRVNVPKAIRKVFWRIVLFYIGAIVIMAFLIPYTDPSLINANNSNVAMSPFTLIFQQAGLKWAGSLVNLVMVTAVLSACNASLYTATRVLWFLADTGQAPRALSKVNHRGVPTRALLITILFGMLSLLLWFVSPGTVFTWLVDASALAGFIAWFGIALSHYRFRKAYILQGRSLSDLPYRAKFYPFGPLFAALLCIAVVAGQVITFPWSWLNFAADYIGLIAFVLLWLAYKVIRKTKCVDLKHCHIP